MSVFTATKCKNILTGKFSKRNDFFLQSFGWEVYPCHNFNHSRRARLATWSSACEMSRVRDFISLGCCEYALSGMSTLWGEKTRDIQFSLKWKGSLNWNEKWFSLFSPVLEIFKYRGDIFKYTSVTVIPVIAGHDQRSMIFVNAMHYVVPDLSSQTSLDPPLGCSVCIYYITLHCIILYYVMLCYVMLCYIIYSIYI